MITNKRYALLMAINCSILSMQPPVALMPNANSPTQKPKVTGIFKLSKEDFESNPFFQNHDFSPTVLSQPDLEPQSNIHNSAPLPSAPPLAPTTAAPSAASSSALSTTAIPAIIAPAVPAIRITSLPPLLNPSPAPDNDYAPVRHKRKKHSEDNAPYTNESRKERADEVTCTQCSRKMQKASLKAHLARHSTLKAFKCATCDHQGIDKSTITTHYFYRHLEDCEECTRLAKNKKQVWSAENAPLRAHIRVAHALKNEQ